MTIDTEFLRETTFWPILCLIQCAAPKASGEYGDADDQNNVFIIDPLADGLDLTPFFELLTNDKLLKVFHAARQDIEIFHKLSGAVPAPIFDTQVAAMVSGCGDSISYDQLVFRTKGLHLDKSSRFTDWRRRPLSEKQLQYAAADVTHLREVYERISGQLAQKGRTHWQDEEMAVLTAAETYEQKPENAWKRLKMRARKPRDLYVLQKVAKWREEQAQKNDVPRGRVLKDDMIYEIAANPPTRMEELGKMRGLSRGFDKSRYGAGLIEITAKALEAPKEDYPKLPRRKPLHPAAASITEILKLLLKLTAEEHGVAAKVIATVGDLEKIATDDEADVEALKGWRYELFGQKALKLKHGKLAITLKDQAIEMIEL